MRSSASSAYSSSARKRPSAGALVFATTGGDQKRLAATARVLRANEDGSLRLSVLFPSSAALHAVPAESVVCVADVLQRNAAQQEQRRDDDDAAAAAASGARWPEQRIGYDASFETDAGEVAGRMHKGVYWPAAGDRIRLYSADERWSKAATVVRAAPEQGIITIELEDQTGGKNRQLRSRMRRIVRYPDANILATVRKGVAVRNGGMPIHSEAELQERLHENSDVSQLVGVQFKEKFGRDSWYWATLVGASQDGRTVRVEYDDGQVLSRTSSDVIEKIHCYRWLETQRLQRHSTPNRSRNSEASWEQLARPLDLQARKLLGDYQQQTRLTARRAASPLVAMATPAAPLNPASANAVVRKQWEQLFRAGNANACVNLLDLWLLEEDGATAVAQWCLEVMIEPNVDPQLAEGAGGMLSRLQPHIARALSGIKARDYLSRFMRRLCTCVEKRLSRVTRMLVCFLHAVNAALRDPTQARVLDPSSGSMPSVAREFVNLWRIATASTSRVLLGREACREAAELLVIVCENQQRVLDTVANALADELAQEELSKMLEALPASRLQLCLLIHICTNSRINSTLILQQVAHLASAHILAHGLAGRVMRSPVVDLPKLPAGLCNSFPSNPLAEVVQTLHS